MSRSKECFKSLLEAGIHKFSLEEFEGKFVTSFPKSSTRPEIFAGLQNFIIQLQSIGIQFELWLDGSYTTEKEDPADIDLVFYARSSDCNGLDADLKSKLQNLIDNPSSMASYLCDVYFAVLEDDNVRSYWRGWYGFDRNESPKGIVQLTIS